MVSRKTDGPRIYRTAQSGNHESVPQLCEKLLARDFAMSNLVAGPINCQNCHHCQRSPKLISSVKRAAQQFLNLDSLAISAILAIEGLIRDLWQIVEFLDDWVHHIISCRRCRGQLCRIRRHGAYAAALWTCADARRGSGADGADV